MAHKIHLLVIDPQRSFCAKVDPASQQTLHDGELCVPGAWEDMERLAALIDRLGDKINDIDITLDSHHQLHIAHPCWFTHQETGQHPSPFTLMREENNRIIGSVNGQDVGEFNTPFRPWTLEYLRSLAKEGRHVHCIWPYHCLIGTRGHNIVEPLAEAIFNWENTGRPGFAGKHTKGSNFRVEHFSAVRAEVIDPNSPDTNLNTAFISNFAEADEILLAGEALSHCLKCTVSDIANTFTLDDSFIKKCVLLTDATSNVPSFEQFGDDFVKEMTSRGMRLSTTVDYLA